MDTAPFFVDHATSNIKLEAGTLREATEFVMRAAAQNSESFTNNYNGYRLLARQIGEQADARGDKNAKIMAHLAENLVLLATGMTATAPIGGDDWQALQKLLSADFLATYRKQLRRHESQEALGLSYYPRIHSLFEDIESSLGQFVFGPQYCPGWSINNDTLILTMGSCFANNIARFLSAFGFRVSNFASPEEASPSTFPKLVDNILKHPDPSARDAIRNSNSLCIIFTAGVGEMVRLKNGQRIDASVLKENPALMRSIEAVELYPPEAIANNIEAGFSALKSLNANVRMVCTVSPVPLEASFAGGQGIMVSNSASKAALLLGVREACTRSPDIAYFPSYEMVKDWAPLAHIKAFAADDGSPRHVSRNLVLIICLMFIRHFVGEARYREILQLKTGSDDINRLRNLLIQ